MIVVETATRGAFNNHQFCESISATALNSSVAFRSILIVKLSHSYFVRNSIV